MKLLERLFSKVVEKKHLCQKINLFYAKEVAYGSYLLLRRLRRDMGRVKRDLNKVFINLESAHDTVPRERVW